MKSYHITAMNQEGKQFNEVIFAEDPQDLVQQIKSKKLYLLDYKEGRNKSDSIVHLKTKSIVIFCRQLGTMVSSGISIIQSLDMLQSKADNAKSKKIFSNIYEEVQKGNSLSQAMEFQKGAFPELLINMIVAGEVGGTLDQSLTRMASHYDKDLKLNNKIRTASVYPIILGVVSLAVVLLLVTFVLPSITSMFPSEDLPGTTRFLLNFSAFILNNYIAILVSIFVIITVSNILLKMKPIRYAVDKAKLRIPMVSKLLRTIYSARAARAMSSLYSSGVQTLDMLDTTAKILNNTYLEDLFYQVMNEVSKGELISKSIENTQEFDPMFHSMLFIGEEAGALETILNSTADYFDDEADSAIARLIALLEPIMLVILGFVIGFIVISIITPIFQMYKSIG